jgi:hypothetical protein
MSAAPAPAPSCASSPVSLTELQPYTPTKGPGAEDTSPLPNLADSTNTNSSSPSSSSDENEILSRLERLGNTALHSLSIADLLYWQGLGEKLKVTHPDFCERLGRFAGSQRLEESLRGTADDFLFWQEVIESQVRDVIAVVGDGGSFWIGGGADGEIAG